jgi:putative nucleotidyltransferase-like protein
LVPRTEKAATYAFELLRACCGDRRQLSQALREKLQWDEVFKQAAYHRVLPALYAALQGRTEVPASIHSALRARYLRHCQRAMRFSTELAGILQHFEAREIPVIAQKGPALAHLLYGDSAVREFGDLDLLVRPADVPRAVGALTELGYEKNLKLSPRQEKAYLQSGYEYVFGRGTERNLIELQWNLLPRFYAVDVKINDLFARSQQHEFDGCRVRMLGPEDQFLFLCVHAAKHQWAQLGMIRDIAATARFDLEWESVLRDARRLGVLRIVMVSLALADMLMGSEIRVAGVKEIAAAQNLVSGILNQMTAMCEIPPESAAYFRFMLQVRERWSDRVRFICRLATTPSVGEWQAIQISDAFFPLYSAVRILRLFARTAS